MKLRLGELSLWVVSCVVIYYYPTITRTWGIGFLEHSSGGRGLHTQFLWKHVFTPFSPEE